MSSKRMKTDFSKLNEECAVFGASLKCETEAAGIVYNGLLTLQHRGQEGAGIATLRDGSIVASRGLGLVSEVFSARDFTKLTKTKLAIGHTRYSTEGDKNALENLQPFVSEYLTGRIALAHNGNLTNTDVLREQLVKIGLSFKASSDSEVVSALIAYQTIKKENALEGVKAALCQLEGAFSLIILSSENKLIAARDRKGYRPLCIGKNELGLCVASESCAVESSGFSFVRDILPGEIVVIENGEVTSSQFFAKNEDTSICVFEYIYFARPDSVIDGLCVNDARFRMGQCLARESYVDADVVCGVPDSGLEAAAGYSKESGIPLVNGFVKNRYIGRSFIYPSQLQRENAVRLKLNPLHSNIQGKSIVLVDDSIVRGTTCAQIINALRNAGASKVHMRISSPPFIKTCHWGTDIGDENNLIANKLNIESICKKIGADSLAYISSNGLLGALEGAKLGFCMHCFGGCDK